MTVAALVSSIAYIENGATTVFAAPFRYKTAASLVADRVLASGVVIPMVYGVDYSATPGPTDAGGMLTVAAPAAPGTRLRIRRVTARSQGMTYPTGDRFPAESHELALDTAMLIDQEQDDKIKDTANRALMVPDGETAGVLSPLASRMGKFPIGRADGGFDWVAGTGNDPALRGELAEAGGVALVTGAMRTDLSNIKVVSTIMTEDALTYPIGNELETYSQWSMTHADKRNDKREFIYSFCANFAHGPAVSGAEYQDHKALRYEGVSMSLACRKAWVYNPLLTIKESCVNPEFAIVTEFDVNNFNKDFGSAEGAAGLPGPSAYGIIVSGARTSAYPITAAVGVLPGRYNRGFMVSQDSATQAAFDDYSSATYSFRDSGTHGIGINLQGTYGLAAIRVPNGAFVASKTSLGATCSVLAVNGANNLTIGDTTSLQNIAVANTVLPTLDNTFQLGTSANRFAALWAVNGAIQTSDPTLKGQVKPVADYPLDAVFDAIDPISWVWNNGGLEPVEAEVIETVQDTEVVESEVAFVDVIDGVARETRRFVPSEKLIWDELPIIDEDGEPVMRDVKEAVLDARGKPVTELVDDVERTVMAFVKVPATHRVPRMVTKPVKKIEYVERPGKRRHFGFDASQIATVSDIIGDDFGGFVMGEDGTQHIRPDQLIPLLWAEVKAMRTRLATLERAEAA